MVSFKFCLVVGVQLSRECPRARYSMEEIFDYAISRLPRLSKFDDFLTLAPDPRHLQGQKRIRKSLCQRLMELFS